MKTNVSPSTNRNWNVDVLLHSPLKERRVGYGRRHFHQLFHQLRVATPTSRRNIVRQDLRHFDDRLGNHQQLRGKELHDIRQLFHRLQHKSIESLDQLVRDAVVPLHLPLRPGLQQRLWPLSPGGPAIVRGKFIVLGRSHPGAGDFLVAPWGVVRSAHLGVRMVGHCSQHRSHCLLLVSPPRAQTALPAPPSGSAFNIHVDRLGLSVKSPQKKWARLSQTPVVVVVEWLYYSKRIIIVRWADLSDFFSFIFVGKMCVCVSRPTKIITFLRKNDYTPKRVVDFPRERDTFRNKIMEIVKDFDEKSYNNNGKPWNSSRILRMNPIFSFFFF